MPTETFPTDPADTDPTLLPPPEQHMMPEAMVGFEAELRPGTREITIPTSQISDEGLRTATETRDVTFKLDVIECTLPGGRGTVSFTKRALAAMLGVDVKDVPGWTDDGKPGQLPAQVALKVQEQFSHLTPRPADCPPIDLVCTGPGDMYGTKMADGIERGGYRQEVAVVDRDPQAGNAEKLLVVMEATIAEVASDYGRVTTTVPRGNVPSELLAGVPDAPSTVMRIVAERTVSAGERRPGAVLGKLATAAAGGALRAALLGFGSLLSQRGAQEERAARQDRARVATGQSNLGAQTYFAEVADMARALQDALRTYFGQDYRPLAAEAVPA